MNVLEKRGEPSMNDDLPMDDDAPEGGPSSAAFDQHQSLQANASSSSSIAATSAVMLSPRPQRRAQAQPVRLNVSQTVRCYRYSQGRPAADATDDRWQARAAHLHYFLPESWSPSYKFTVFEDSYVLSFAPGEGESCEYFLARPLHGALTPTGVAESLEFELVWPIELDRALVETVEAACDRVVPGVKRKPAGLTQTLSLHSVHLKLQRLEM